MADLLDQVNLLLRKAEGRDKLARVFQYCARTIVGFSSLAAPTAGTTLANFEGHARTAMVQLAGARRTHRWCKEFLVIQGISKCSSILDPVDRLLDFLQKMSLATFMVIDHIGMLKQWKILPGGKRSGSGTIQLGLKFFCFCNFVSVVQQLKKYVSLNSANDDKVKEKGQSLKALLKHALLVLQTAHLSSWYQSHDAFIGVAGIITSSIDLSAQWPTPKSVAPKVAPLRAPHVAGVESLTSFAQDAKEIKVKST